MRKNRTKLLVTAILIMTAMMVAACGGGKQDSDGDDNGNSGGTAGPALTASYLGGYMKLGHAMGDISGRQLLNLYEDGSCKIFLAFSMSIQSSSAVYNGTYTLEQNLLQVAYTHPTNSGDEEKSFEAQIEGGKFRAQIYMIMSMPNDDSDINVPGLNFYRVPNTEVVQGTTQYMGTVETGAEYVAAVLTLKSDTDFSVALTTSEASGVIGGSYVVKRDNEDNWVLTLTYDIKTIADGAITDVTAEGGGGYSQSFLYNNDENFVCTFKIGGVGAPSLNISILSTSAGA